MNARKIWDFVREYRTLLVIMVVAAVAIVACLVALSALSALSGDRDGEAQSMAAEPERAVAAVALDRKAAPAVNGELVAKQERQALVDRVRANWRDATGVQPDLRGMKDITVDVSLKDQMVYVKSEGRTVYEMVASTGINDTTPHGTFRTNGQGGDHFFTPRDHMGGDYWTRITGVYLFHSVPTREEAGDYIVSEAVKLGEPASHGCVRLTVADAKWIHEQLPKGTPVTIE